MRLRGARKSDFYVIEKLFRDHEFELDFKHIECLVVIEDDDEDDDGINNQVIAVGSLQTILEAAFVVDKDKSKKKRAKALKLLLEQANIETSRIDYPGYHLFATNDSIEKILIHRGARPVNGKVLIKFL